MGYSNPCIILTHTRTHVHTYTYTVHKQTTFPQSVRSLEQFSRDETFKMEWHVAFDSFCIQSELFVQTGRLGSEATTPVMIASWLTLQVQLLSHV